MQLFFNEAPDLAVSKLEMVGPADKAKLVNTHAMGKSLMATVQGDLPDGAYTLQWQAAGDDGHVQKGEVNPCIIVDDIIRSGDAILQTVELVRELGARVVGCGTIVRFRDSLDKINGDIPIKSLVEFDSKFYEEGEECVECKNDAPTEHVRF